MDDFDPFSTKVGDVYDSSGKRVGSIRDHSQPAPFVVPLMGLPRW
jgi:hypothetical protein